MNDDLTSDALAVPAPETSSGEEPAVASGKSSVRPQKPAKKKPDGVTPMMVQYLAIKSAHPDSLLFYRMGDFYELFFEDAVKASAALDITLTKRGKHLGADIAMCGVPVHAAEAYLARLIRKKFRVAVCEQTEDPAEARKRGNKSVVRREVVRLVTPGTITEEALLEARSHNYLVAIARAGGDLALAETDMSTGRLSVRGVTVDSLESELARLRPGEVIIPEGLLGEDEITRATFDWRGALTPRPAGYFSSADGETRLKALFAVKTLDGYGAFTRAELAALGALIRYLEDTQKGQMPRLNPPRREASSGAMLIDAATRRNLELVRTLDGASAGSLLSTIDRTVTGGGARLLARRLAAPLTDATLINARLDGVGFFTGEPGLCDLIRGHLRGTPDMERALSRLSLERGGPRDLGCIRDALTAATKMKARLMTVGDALTVLPAELEAALDDLGSHDALIDTLARALEAELPMIIRDGGFIARGFDAALDELKDLKSESRRHIAALEARYREEVTIPSLKIKHNNVLGYHIDVSARHGDRLMQAPLNETFIHRQTLANAVRFSTADLAALAAKIGEAADRALALEHEIFARLQRQVMADWQALMRAASALAVIDVAAANADMAAAARYVRPGVDASTDFEVTGGRHPVVEAALGAAGGDPFIANDCDLSDASRLWLVTGPNMAGKSTFLRQNALIAIMAQMGAYVPASRARIGVVDRLFSRVGASDDLARGRSTFMVEMVETAAILNQAGPRALVILDEIGRGTATYDGLSIAWAAVENLHDVNRCRALFATHYHELTALHEKLDHIALHAMRVKEWQGDVVFLHEVGPGAADRSYGIQVAKLAGLPAAVVARAEQVLSALEASEQGKAALGLADDLPLFQTVVRQAQMPQSAPLSMLRETLDAINPDELSPREALEALYTLKAVTKREEGDA